MSFSVFLSVLISGVFFGFGLSYSAMIQPEVVLSFLRFDDFGLLWVLGAASFLTLLVYQIAPRLLQKPLFQSVFKVHPSELNRDTLLGAIVFGIGWGICGVCPGPAIAGIGAGNWPIGIALLSIFAGAFVQGKLVKSN